MISSIEDHKGLPPFAALRAFEAVGRLSGIRRAAQILSIDHAVISRHMRRLEDWAGVRLFDRTGGNTLLTPEGQRYHARVTAALAEIGDASKELLSRNSDRQLRIWCTAGFAYEWLASRLHFFQIANPEIVLELRPADVSPDFARYEADVDIRYVSGMRPISPTIIRGGLRRFEISRPPVLAVASPECISRLSSIDQPRDLLRAPLLHEEDHKQWQSWLAEHGVVEPGQLPGIRLWQAHLTVEAARRGQGIALANPFLLGDDLAKGILVNVLVGLSRPIVLGSYVFAARADRWQLPTIVQFRHWLRRAIARVSPPAGESVSGKFAMAKAHGDGLFVSSVARG